MHRLVIVAAALLLSGCVQPEGVVTASNEPTARLIKLKTGQVLACMSEQEHAKPEWVSACAPVGEWVRCTETATSIQCGMPGRAVSFN